jgi:hypothetical protein
MVTSRDLGYADRRRDHLAAERAVKAGGLSYSEDLPCGPDPIASSGAASDG